MSANEDLIDLYRSMPEEHRLIWQRTCGNYRVPMFEPDLVIAPDGKPYLYRWHLEREWYYGVNFHIQVASDPERPLHDHPWDNSSFILAGGYEEIVDEEPQNQMSTGMKRGRGHNLQSFTQFTAFRQEGKFYQRNAATAHRLILPNGMPYTMTRFAFGPKVKEWGFWYPDGFHHNTQHVADRDGQSLHVNRPEEM